MLKKGKIHFFTGKGGVGKSHLSMNFATELASAGHNTLWLEFNQNPSEHKALGPVSFQPKKISENLSVASWNGEDCLQEFVKYSVKLRLIYETFYRSKAINALIKAAPALREIAFLGYLTSHLRDVKPALDYDQIVVDAPSTGHFLSCLRVPLALLDVSDFGPMGFHCRGILKVLRDPTLTTIYNIFLAEPLVVSEYEFLKNELHKSGFESKPWFNKALSPKLLEDLNGLSAAEFETHLKAIENLQTLAQQQNQVLKGIKDKDLILTSDTSIEALKIEFKEIVKSLN